MPGTDTKRTGKLKFEGLPPELIQEVIDFIEFLKIKKMKKAGVDYESLLLQQESLSRIWKAESEDLYEL